MENWLIAVIIGGLSGLFIGVKIARDSNAKQPVCGGTLSRLFHYLACAGLTSTVPFAIAGVIIGLSILTLFSTVLGFLALTGIFLLAHAGFESGSRPTSAAH